LARIHAKAKKMGIVETKDLKGECCPCCRLPINKKELKLCAPVKDYHSVGIGCEFYFIYVKFMILLLIMIFLISGLYDMVNALKQCKLDFSCHEKYIFEDIKTAENREIQLMLDTFSVIFSCLYIGLVKTYFKI
jgi:hypothetical protein